MILAVVFPSGTIPESSIPFFALILSSLRRAFISFESDLIISLAILVLHLAQVSSPRSVIVEPLRKRVAFSGFNRLMPQPVLLPLTVPCTSELEEAVTSITSITISLSCGGPQLRFTAATADFTKDPSYGGERLRITKCPLLNVRARGTAVYRTILYKYIIIHLTKKINTLLKNKCLNYTKN